MSFRPIANIPLDRFLRPDIALQLRHLVGVQTLGGLLKAWTCGQREDVERIFDTPGQALMAVQTCATWLGAPSKTFICNTPDWWPADLPKPLSAVAPAAPAV
jgi:hypothetical protein